MARASGHRVVTAWVAPSMTATCGVRDVDENAMANLVDLQRLWMCLHGQVAPCRPDTKDSHIVDIRTVVCDAESNRKRPLIVSGAQVPGIGRLPQHRLVSARRVNAAGLRSGVAVVAGKTESSKPSRQIGQPLLVRDLKTRDVGTAGIGWLLN